MAGSAKKWANVAVNKRTIYKVRCTTVLTLEMWPSAIY